MLAALLTICAVHGQADLDALQGTWVNACGTARLVIDGDWIAVSSSDGYSYFEGRLVLTPSRLHVVDADRTITRVRWKLEGGRLWLDETEWRLRLRDSRRRHRRGKSGSASKMSPRRMR